MTEAEDTAYAQGQRMVYFLLLQQCLRALGVDDPAAGQARWVSEREQAVAQLRSVCRYFGDNEWGENLHLADVIDKHLARHLHGRDVEIAQLQAEIERLKAGE